MLPSLPSARGDRHGEVSSNVRRQRAQFLRNADLAPRDRSDSTRHEARRSASSTESALLIPRFSRSPLQAMALAAPLLMALLALAGCKNASAGPPAARGREIYALCTQCHGQNGEGNADLRAPAIAGQHAWYVATQLRKFRDGVRGKHPDDLAGLRMRPMALALKSDADIAAVAEYVGALSPRPPVATLGRGSAEKGSALYSACASCHGPDGAGKPELKAPALVRTNDWYLLSQLQNFKKRVRGASPSDTEAALMLPFAASLADDQAMLDVLAHLQTLR